MVPTYGDRDFPFFDANTGNNAGVIRVDTSGNIKLVFTRIGYVPSGTRIRTALSYVI